jgi:hypothetical protein
MGIANVRGKFSEFEGTLDIKEQLADSRAHGAVKVASIDTGEAQRDEHLRSPDFFDVEAFRRSPSSPLASRPSTASRRACTATSRCTASPGRSGSTS